MQDIPKSSLPHALTDVLKRAAYVLWGSVSVVVIAFTWRGLAGAFERDLSTLAACLATTFAALCTLIAWGCDFIATRPPALRSHRIIKGLFTLGPPILLGLVLVPASSNLALVWNTILGVGVSLCLWNLERQPGKLVRPEDTPVPSDAESNSKRNPDVTHWMTRRTIIENDESWDHIEGQTLANFAIGQQQVTVHLSICPPMSNAPEIECDLLDDIDFEWKISAAHPYGARIEIRAKSPVAKPVTISLGYIMAALVAEPTKSAA